METYSKYNNLNFERFSLDRILDSMEDSRGFLLASVFQKKFSLDVNLKRHEDMKIWLKNQGYRFVVLDGVQKVIDKSEDKIYDYSILYLLVFFNDTSLEENTLEDLVRITLKRYELSQIILKNPINGDLESWNRDFEKKVIKNITNHNLDGFIQYFFDEINRKRNKFYFQGIEKTNHGMKSSHYYSFLKSRPEEGRKIYKNAIA